VELLGKNQMSRSRAEDDHAVGENPKVMVADLDHQDRVDKFPLN
jgi:hypothetical protein